MKINAQWHKDHRMPKNPSLEERTLWHIEYHKNCDCRDIPLSIQEEIRKRGV